MCSRRSFDRAGRGMGVMGLMGMIMGLMGMDVWIMGMDVGTMGMDVWG